jgi:hypothetical protein
VSVQGFKKDFEDAGFTIQTKQLADFQDAYGLEGEEDDEDIEVSGSESGSGSEDSESGDEMEE